MLGSFECAETESQGAYSRIRAVAGVLSFIMTLTLFSYTSPVLAVVLWLLIMPCILSSSRMSDDFCLSVSCKGHDLLMNLLVNSASSKDENIKT